ncbi:MAG: DUF4085 family protein [Lachnospiraceae bacterium]|nr:DUF4085 family protein [Lachnospiraceae bacterium]
MRYFTKEWYDLMQRLDYTCGMKKISDKEYSTEEIRELYDRALKKEVVDARRSYNTPPSFEWKYTLLEPDRFDPENFLIVNQETGEWFHPETVEIAKNYVDEEYRKAWENFENRPAFDPTETIRFFEECYRDKLRWRFPWLPEWVVRDVDIRLLALDYLPEGVFRQLRKEEQKNKRAFERIMKKAQADLEQQKIPEDIKKAFCLHDAHLLSLKRIGSDVELCLSKDGAWPDGTPYIRLRCKNVTLYEREKGLVIRKRMGQSEEWESNCVYLYHELYRAGTGYEIHLLLTSRKLHYLTIGCEDVTVEDNIRPEEI